VTGTVEVTTERREHISGLWITRSEAETMRLGEELARHLRPGDVVAVSGALGTGKTCFIQGVCRGLGVREPVTSPSFIILNQYAGTVPVFHFDFYRLSSKEALEQLGLEEYLDGPGVCLLEWAERVLDVLPEHRYDVEIRWPLETAWEHKRQIVITRRGAEDLLENPR